MKVTVKWQGQFCPLEGATGSAPPFLAPIPFAGLLIEDGCLQAASLSGFVFSYRKFWPQTPLWNHLHCWTIYIHWLTSFAPLSLLGHKRRNWKHLKKPSWWMTLRKMQGNNSYFFSAVLMKKTSKNWVQKMNQNPRHILQFACNFCKPNSFCKRKQNNRAGMCDACIY